MLAWSIGSSWEETSVVKLWKALGLAGLAGVTATGVIIARDQRQRAQLTPDQIRARLHERVERPASSTDDGTGE
jgi:hypothetical protein